MSSGCDISSLNYQTQVMKELELHGREQWDEKRCWGVDFSPMDSTRFACGVALSECLFFFDPTMSNIVIG